MANTVPLTFASQVLTASGTFTNAQTVVVGGKTYTTLSTLTDSDGNVAIGDNAAETLQNLYDAINLTGTPGEQYAASMTRNSQVQATGVTATTLTVRAKIPGTIGNNIASTETQTNASWGAATLAGGTGDIGEWINSLLQLNQINAEVLYELKKLTPGAD